MTYSRSLLSKQADIHAAARSNRFSFSTLAVAIAASLAHSALSAQELDHREERLEEIVVTATLHRSRADTVLPVNLLAGEELREKLGATLGATLSEQVGINSASFGPGVGAPVIRGQSANRVQVLQGGIGNIDASSVSPDHANSLEPALATRIEVVRGPATLLYGNGAIGGVVNVIDNRIPTQLTEGVEGMLESRHNSVSDQQVSVGLLEGSVGQLAWHIDGVYRESNDLEIPGFALNPALVDTADSEALDELAESRGVVRNTGARSNAQSVGASWIFDEGYVGVAFNRLDNQYGIPAGSHAHHEDEHHGDDGHDVGNHEEHDDHHDEMHADENVLIDMQQERFDLEFELPLAGFFDEVHGRVGVVDYEHVEIEGTEIGTRYTQSGVEGRVALHQVEAGGRQGVVGFQGSIREFSALGSEAFIPETDISTAALFTVQSLDTGSWLLEAGARIETQKLDQVAGSCDQTDTTWSGSGSALWRFSEDTNAIFSLSRSERAATIDERYSNIQGDCTELPLEAMVQHAATQRLEVGLPNAETERATNLEFGLRKHAGDLTGELNFFYNDIADYIYLANTELEYDEVMVSRFRQEDASFMGLEAKLSAPLRRSGDHLTEIAFFADYVRAELDQSGDVPRIPPLRAGIELQHSHVHWQAKLRWQEVQEQDNVAFGELASPGYSLLSAYADWHFDLGNREALLFVRGTNLLDEEIREHPSFLKEVAPGAGRAWELGVRFNF